MHNHHLSNFLSHLVIKNKTGHISFTYRTLTKSILANVKFLAAFNFISGYSVTKCPKYPGNYHITVYLKYRANTTYPLLRNIKFYSSPGVTRYVTLQRIKYLTQWKSSHNILHVLSTSNGIFTAAECWTRRIGGKLLYRLEVG